VNSNPFANYYEIAPGVWNYHDGVDLNLNTPNWNADWHKPVYAMADGQVYFAGVGGGSWGHIICIVHLDLFTETYYHSRYGHVENPCVATGDIVHMGQQIANVGNGDGYYGQSGAHLHWNICASTVMWNKPNQWCGTNKACVLANYVDPIQFIKERAMLPNPDTAKAMREALAKLPIGTPVTITPALPPGREPFGTQLSYIVPVEDVVATVAPEPPPPPPSDPAPTPKQATVTADPFLRVRVAPSTSAAQIGELLKGAIVMVVDNGTADGLTWCKITEGDYRDKFVAKNYLSFQ
jgi:murein DD-endopeptidase MepM/ murein hydrolase activator NlpD